MSNARDLQLLLDFLPSLSNKKVLQIGSDEDYTRVFAEKQAELFSVKQLVDIIPETFQPDLIFSDSKFIDQADDVIVTAVEKSLSVLNDGGYLLLREPFDTVTATATGLTPIKFIDLIQSKTVDQDGVQFGYDLVFAKPYKALKLLYNTVDETDGLDKMTFLFAKAKAENWNGFKTLKEFMDNKQYTRNGILRYEKIFGAGFISTGGSDTTLKFFESFDLKPGQKVLDVGSGIGGGDFLMAEKFGVDILGLDLCSNVVGIAWERKQDHKDLNVHFEIGDVRKQNFPANTFDLIYSRDTILHIDTKRELFAKFKDWLKPGGKVFITDYCCGPKPWSDNYAAYVEQRGYTLLTPEEYGQVFKDLGFSHVEAEDTTSYFVECLKAEIVKFEAYKAEFVEQFSEKDYQDLINGWNEKIVRCDEGHQRWGKISCQK